MGGFLIGFLKRVNFILVLLFCLSCSVVERDEKIAFLATKHNIVIDSSIERIYVLNERGRFCKSCFNAFSACLAEKELGNNELLLINNNGNFLQRERFLNKKNTYLIYDPRNHSLEGLPDLGILYLKGNQIDSVVYVNPQNINRIIAEIR